ncbi:SusC/RagA family TonB-linked outer membrane protein [Aestuariibaculum suncheonense]|nr:SusC/RagA family TonB-linked outer membrane protein [Aestuariibaculum suncheonense]
MRTFIFLWCISMFGFSSNNAISQNSKIKIKSDATLTVDQVFSLIKNQTEYNFIYEVGLFDEFPSIEVKKGTISTKKLLQQTLEYKHLNVLVSSNNTIIIKKSEEGKKVIQSQITGTVTDKKGVPLPGVTIAIKGTIKGTATDFDGKFELLSNPDNILVFSFLGYLSKSVEVGNQTVINVVLEENINELEEVLVTGYQTISKERATGAFSKLNTDDFKSQRLNDLNTIIEGRVAGFQNGVLRGTTTMKGLTTPLYVIDGFPIENTRYTSTGALIENLPELNLEDIQSITVLKDAAATSIYGARAANGVVVIVTKKAKTGKTSVSFSSNLTVSPYRYYVDNLTDAGDIVDLEREWANGNPRLQATDGSAQTYAQSLLTNAVFTSQGMQSILNYYAGNISENQSNDELNKLGALGYQYYDDIEKYAKRSPFYQQYNVSLGKASESNSFNASITYKSNEYEDLYSNDESVGINLRNSTQVTNWLTVDLGTYTKFQDGNTQTYNTLSPGFTYQPYNRLVDESGNNFVSTAESRYNASTLNAINTYGLYSMDITPIEELGRNIKENKNFTNRTYAKLDIKVVDWLKYNAMFQYEYGVDRGSQLMNKESFAVRNKVNQMASASNGVAVYNIPYGNIYNETQQYANAYNFRQQIDIDKIFADKHELTAILGTEVRHSKLEYKSNTLYNYDTKLLSFSPVDQKALLNASGLILGGFMYSSDFAQAREITNRFVSVYGNTSYTYNRKYTATGSLRWDRSNLWGTDSKYQNKPTWSVGGSWNISSENFFDVTWVDMLKLRASNGIGGNIAKNSAPYMTASYFPSNTVGGTYGYVSSRPNPQLSWEKTTTTNIGLDFALFKNRLNGALEFYNKKGEDLLANTQGVPTEGYGYSTYTINNGEMQNRGLEITLNGTVVKAGDFSWDATGIFGYNKNKVTYVNVEAPVYFLQLDYPSEFPRIGTPYNSIYGYKWAGLSQTGLPQVYDSEDNALSSQPNDLESIQNFGSTVPKYSGSFSSTFKYKNFDLSMLFIFQGGHKIRNTQLPMLKNGYNGALRSYVSNIGVVNNKIANRWMQPGDELTTNVPRAIFEYDSDFSSALYSIYSLADINILDATHLRLSNVSLAYNLPKGLLSKLNVSSARMNFNVENAFTIAKSRDAKFMLNGFNAPNFVFGINLNF